MADIKMTSYRPRADPRDEADARVNLMEPEVKTTSPQTQLNSAKNGCVKKCQLKEKIQFVKNNSRCKTIAIVASVCFILVIILSVVLLLTLKPGGNRNDNTSNPSVYVKHNISQVRSKSQQSTTTIPITTEEHIPWITEYKTFTNPGDSRIFKIQDKSGQVVRVYGKKSTTGQVMSLNHISVSDDTGSDTHIRLGSGNNMASVVLPDDTHVSFDMSVNFRNLEMRIFTSNSGELNSRRPSAFVETVSIDQDVSVLSKLLFILSNPNTVNSVSQGSDGNKLCAPYLPLRVTKCGNQYPYKGAFIEGKVWINHQEPILMVALPFPDETDECYSYTSTSESRPNYYIPLPFLSNERGEFCNSYLNYIQSVCSNADVYDQGLYNTSCHNLAQKASLHQNGHRRIYTSVLKSCSAIFNSINSLCTNIQHHIGVSPPSWKLSVSEYSELCHPTYQEDFNLLDQSEVSVVVQVLAFCPSLIPFRSPDQSFIIKANQSKSVGGPIHINCDGSPEVTYMSAGHALAGRDQLDRIMYRFKVCSICAFEMSISAQMTKDSICCNDTCANDEKCNYGQVPISEESNFKRHSAVYCHDFLVDRSYPTTPFPRKCLGNCKTDLSLDFTMSNNKKTFYHQRISCQSKNKNQCSMQFGR